MIALSTTLTRALRAVALAAVVTVVGGCASTGAPLLHSLHYCNAGQATLTRIRIRYGEVTWPMVAERNYKGDGHDPKCLGGAVITHDMPVPETMRVEWKLEDGRAFSVDVPVRSRLLRGYAPNTIQVQFKDEQIEVFEYAYPTKGQEVTKQIHP